jgi:hypothetical protein
MILDSPCTLFAHACNRRVPARPEVLGPGRVAFEPARTVTGNSTGPRRLIRPVPLQRTVEARSGLAADDERTARLAPGDVVFDCSFFGYPTL